MSDGEIIGWVFAIITVIGFYGIIGTLIGMVIDVMDNKVLFSCIFLWPIMLPIYLTMCLVKTIKRFGIERRKMKTMNGKYARIVQMMLFGNL